jgi:membrane peptidoglycan carboxypeptidase
MKTVMTSGTATAAQLSTGQESAGKTGTSENYRDHWLVAYTPQLSTAVWIGSREEQSLPGIDCCYVWRTFMTMALEGSAIEPFPTAPDPKYDNAFNTSQNNTLGYTQQQQQQQQQREEEQRRREQEQQEQREREQQQQQQQEQQDQQQQSNAPENTVPATPTGRSADAISYADEG